MTQLDRISGYGHVAIRYGVEESIFLDAIVYWYKENKANGRNFHEGRWWTYNSMSAFDEIFPWWSSKQIRRIINSCKDQGALLVGNFNEDRRDRTVWYSPGDELLGLYGFSEIGNCICPNGQMQKTDTADGPAQMGGPLPCYKHHVDTPYNPPQGDDPPRGQKKDKPAPDWGLFDRFWKAYPKKKAKERARRAWAKLAPDLELCRVMSAALDRDKQSPEWRKDGGAYIPHPATWLNGRRWEDEPDLLPSAPHEPSPAAPLRGEGVRYLE